MSADDMLARLMSMADDDAPVTVKTEPKAKAKPKAEQAVERAARPAATAADPEPVPSGAVIPVVVLDDGATFSDIAGAKVCFVPPDCEQIEADAYANGVSVSDLLTLRDALDTILRIVRR
jgi:hypothetical protein